MPKQCSKFKFILFIVLIHIIAIQAITKIRKYREKKEFSLSYFRKAVRWGGFLFSGYSILMIKCSLQDCVFVFPGFSVCTSSTYARVSCRNRLFVISGKGSSGLLRTKKVGAASRLDDNLHTSISLQVSILAVKPCLSYALPFYATETKTTDPTKRRIKKCRICKKQGKRKWKLNSLSSGIRIKSFYEK